MGSEKETKTIVENTIDDYRKHYRQYENIIDVPIITSQSTSESCDNIINLAIPTQHSVEQRTQNRIKKFSESPLFVKAITIKGQSDNAETLNVIQQYVPESCNTRISIKCSNGHEKPTSSKARIINRSSKAVPSTSKSSVSSKGVISKTEKDHLNKAVIDSII